MPLSIKALSIKMETPLVLSYKRFKNELLSYLQKQFGHSIADAEDLLHTAFEKLSRHSGTSEFPKVLCYRVVHNLAVDNYRKNQSADRLKTHLLSHQSLDDSRSPERTAQEQETLSDIAQVIQHMPSRRRVCLLKSRFEGKSYVQIATELGITEGAVRKHVKKALQDCMAVVGDKL